MKTMRSAYGTIGLRVAAKEIADRRLRHAQEERRQDRTLVVADTAQCHDNEGQYREVVRGRRRQEARP